MVLKMIICDAISKYRNNDPCKSRVADYVCKSCGKTYCERHMHGKYSDAKKRLTTCLFCKKPVMPIEKNRPKRKRKGYRKHRRIINE